MQYSYYLIEFDLGEVRGYDLDPTHSPSTHRHIGSGHTRQPFERIELEAAIADFWDVLTDIRIQEPPQE